MTEIDTTPAAYARYMANQQRVGNWAADATAHAAEYLHPFESHQPRRRADEFGPVPEVRPSDSISLYEPPERRHARQREEARRRDEERAYSREYSRSRELVVEAPRPRRARALTAPGPGPQALPRGVVPPPPQPMYYMQPQPAPASSSRLHRSNSQSRHAPPPPPAPLVRTSSRSTPHSRAHSPPRVHATMQATAYRTVDLRHQTVPAGKEIQLPPVRPGESYMIIPPKGRRVEVINQNPSGPYTFRTTAVHPASAPTSPTYHPAQGYPVAPRTHPSSKTASRSPSRGAPAPVPMPPPGYFLAHAPAQPSPLHASAPVSPGYAPAQHVYAYGAPPPHDSSPTKKKGNAPLLKRLLTTHVTWGENKPSANRRSSH